MCSEDTLETEGGGLKTKLELFAVERCLEQMSALGAELGLATKAIVANAISAFEESIERQNELLCLLAVSFPLARVAAASETNARETGGLASRLQASVHKLRMLSAQYAALLVHARRSLQMLQSIHELDSLGLDTLLISASSRGKSWSLQG